MHDSSIGNEATNQISDQGSFVLTNTILPESIMSLVEVTFAADVHGIVVR